jgi:hypothetical protein
MVATLRSASCCVYQAHDGLAALKLVLGLRNIDLLIATASMPGIEEPELSAGRVPDGLPPDVPTLRNSFTGAELLEAARALLDGRH